MNSVVMNQVSFGYEDGMILRDVNLIIEKGDYVGIIGSNGTGKSTLIKLILGLLQTKTGNINILEDSIGYVPQVGLAVKADFPATVREVVMFNLYRNIGLFKRPKKIHQEMVDAALDLVGMKEFSNKLISNLSGGQQQRVLIAKSLVNKPSILILDEPSAGVDGDSEQKFYNLLYELNKEEGITIIMVTHNIHNVSGDMNKIYEVKNQNIKLIQTEQSKTEKKGVDQYAVSV